ncbi:MAG: folate-binding protein YgfZ [Mariprofundus sp.]|nr:folate-binding protein YgfZ [Mariprofundus sp.]
MSLYLPTISAATAAHIKQAHIISHNNRWSVLKASGSNIRQYLQGQITQDIEKLNSQQAIHSCILSPQGKAVSEIYIIAGHNDELIILTPSSHAVATVERLRQFSLGQQLRIGVVDSLAVATAHGVSAINMLTDFGIQADSSHSDWLACSNNEAEDTFAMNMQSELQSYWVIGAKTHLDQIIHKQQQANDGELEALRILHGQPVFGVEWDERLHPLNANLIEFDGVDFKKGCYVGQEVTSRMHWRGGIKKKLYRVQLDAQPLELPCPIRSSANIGELKSAAIDAQGSCFGIALLPIETAESHVNLTLEQDNNVTILEVCHA